MKKFLKNEESYKRFVSNVVTGILIVLCYFVFSNFEVIRNFISKLLGILSPFIWGALLAFILLKLASRIEKKLPFKKAKTNRFVSSLLSVLIVIALVVVFFIILIPQTIESIGNLAVIVENFTSSATNWLSNFSKNSIIPDDVLSDLYKYSSTIVSSLWEIVKASIPNIIDFTKATFSAVLNFVVGFIVALYILIDRDKLASEIGRFFKAVLPKKTFSNATKVISLAYDKFSSFFVGKTLDSFIIGVICFVFMYFTKLEFPGMISIIVGVTNIIPFFGPFIGAIPSTLILLMVSPQHALVFVIFIFILQQIDGNIIGPKILGEQVGLSSLWIMFAIIVGGGYFGFMGMLLGVPVFAIIYFTIKEYVDTKLEYEKEIKMDKE